MAYRSDHDKVVKQKRTTAMEDLIDNYIAQAINASDENQSLINVMGQEVPDPTVVEPPLGYIQQPDLMELMRRMVRGHLSDLADQQELETFDEADDFEIDDDPVDYSSPYEMYFDPAPGAPTGPPADPNGRLDPNAETPPQPPPAAPQAPPEEPK